MEYFYGNESAQYSYFRIPKLLFTDPAYRGLSTDAKLLYGLMLDRLGLSMHNGWFDELGRAYIFFRRDEIEEEMAIGHTLASQLLKELEAVELLERRRVGVGMPARIYVGRFVRSQQIPRRARAEDAVETGAGAADVHSSGKRTSERPKNGRPPVRKTDECYRMNKTEMNKTESSLSSSPLSADAMPPRLDKQGYEDLIKEQISFLQLTQDRPDDAEVIAGYVDLMSGICSSHRQWCRIAGDDHSRAEVRAQLLRLRRNHIEYVLDSMQEAVSVRNVKAYTLAALYNAPATIAQHSVIQRAKKAAEEAEKHRNDWMNEYM